MVSVEVLLFTMFVAASIIIVMAVIMSDLASDRDWWKKQAKIWDELAHNAKNQLFYQRMKTISAVMAESRALQRTTDAIEIAEGWKELYMSVKGENND